MVAQGRLMYLNGDFECEQGFPQSCTCCTEARSLIAFPAFESERERLGSSTSTKQISAEDGFAEDTCCATEGRGAGHGFTCSCS